MSFLALSFAIGLGVSHLRPEAMRRVPAKEAGRPLLVLSPPAAVPSKSTPARPSGPRTHSVRKGETMWSIARRYGLDLPALMAANPMVVPERMRIGTVLRLPEGKAGLASRQGGRSSGRTWQWPLAGRITSRYGWRWGRMHRGLDIAAPAGTPVRAAASGKVLFAGWRSGYGLLVILGHPGGWRTAYGHNSRLYVKTGQWVPAGGLLAGVGATGNATGAHLHFEVRAPGGYVDPLRVLP
ncbi:MAG: peptidoglycan DD-metalloendopeptidase family protein [Firmicutes bacterium]|nr:peptidoglycan DD-metalloendopeptidase family protein [Bacillota bacterium]